MTNILCTRAPTKVNLVLHILGVRPDGYHELSSLVAFTGWGDVLTFAPRSPKEPAFTLSVEGPFASFLDENSYNLVLKAASGFSDRFPHVNGGHFTLVKNIPVAAGLGGGSSDGAAVLRLLSCAHGVPMTHPDLLELAFCLGSDVTVCLKPQLHLMEGLGERVIPLEGAFNFYGVLINPRVPLSTASVFRCFDRIPQPSSLGRRLEEFKGDIMAAILQGKNALEEAAQMLCPEVTAALELLRLCEGGIFARMSGSGPTVWGLFPNRQSAIKATQFIKEVRPEWWVRPCLLR